MTRPRAADDFPAIRARMEELRERIRPRAADDFRAIRARMGELRRERAHASAERRSRSAIHARPCRRPRAADRAEGRNHLSRVGNREARADGESGEMVDRVAAGAPVGKFFAVEALRHTRMPFAGRRPDHRVRVELAAIDTHRAAEAAADLERRLDDGVAREARRDRFENT